jgi:hypothetical protein
MRTIFQMGFAANPFMLGQQAMSDAEKTALYDQLVDAEGKLDVVAEWKKNHPQTDADLGADAPLFHGLEAHLASVQTVAKDVMKRVEGADPVQLTLTELAQTKDWMNDAHQLYVIAANHTGTLPSQGPSGTAPAPRPALNPWALGIGAVGLLILMVAAAR